MVRTFLVWVVLAAAGPAVAQPKPAPAPAKPVKPAKPAKPDLARVEPGKGWWCVSAWADRDGMNAACARTEAACKTIAEAAKGLEQPAGTCKQQSKAYVATVVEGTNVVMRTRGDCKTRRDRIAAGGVAISACGSVGKVLTAEEAEAARREDDVVAFAALLTSESEGTITGIDSRRQPGGDLAAQIADVREGGTDVAVGGSAARGSRGDGDPRIGLGGGSVVDATPPGRISISSKEALSESTLTVDKVVAKIQAAYMAGVKRCYREGLKKEPTMRGKLTLLVAVNETGRAIDAKSAGPSAELDACVAGLTASWRFPIPKDTAGEATTAAFKIQLLVVPD